MTYSSIGSVEDLKLLQCLNLLKYLVFLYKMEYLLDIPLNIQTIQNSIHFSYIEKN